MWKWRHIYRCFVSWQLFWRLEYIWRRSSWWDASYWLPWCYWIWVASYQFTANKFTIFAVRVLVQHKTERSLHEEGINNWDNGMVDSRPKDSHHSNRSCMAAGLNNSIGPIARNCPKWPSGNHICGPKLPAKLVFWKFGQQTFSCVNQLLTAHPTRSRFWEAFYHLVLNHFLFMVSMTSSPLYFDYMTS